MNNPQRGKWYKFNDTDVQAFDMTDTALEEECFGGTYKAKVYEQCERRHLLSLEPFTLADPGVREGRIRYCFKTHH